MKNSHEKIVADNIEYPLRYVEGDLKAIKKRMAFQGPYVLGLTNFLNSIKAIAEYANSEPSKFKHYSEEEINNFSFDQIEKLLFASQQESVAQMAIPKSNSIVNEVVLATKGIIADVISPVLNFTLGEEIKFSPEITASAYGKATAGIRGKISSLRDNDSVVEAAAIARIALGNILVNKAALYIAIGAEPLPDPKWLKNTKNYEYTCKVSDKTADYLGPGVIAFLQEKKESNEVYKKLYGSKAKKIVNLVLAGLAIRNGGKMLPLAFATAKVTYSTYLEYIANETTRAISDEKYHLEKYIDAKNRTNLVLEQNPQLERILGIQKEDSITTDLDGQLAKIYEANPILKKIFQADQQTFASEKEKIIFVQVLKELVKTNDNLKGEYKIWQADNLDISEKKLKIAKIHFTRIYKDKFKRYQEPKQAEVLSSVGTAVKSKLLDAVLTLYSAIQSGKKEDITSLTNTLISVFTGQSGKAFLNETKQMKNLAEIAALKMDVPEYGGEQGVIGTYKHDLANMAFNRQVEAITLERMAKKELSVSDKEILELYNDTKAKVEEDLKKDPLFSESILNPTEFTKLYDIGAGVLNSLNPWGGKPTKTSQEKKTTKAEESFEDAPLEKEVQVLESSVELKAPSQTLQDLIPSDLQEKITSFKIIEPSVDRSSQISIANYSSPPRSPITTATSFSPPITPDKKFDKDIISDDELTEIRKTMHIDHVKKREEDIILVDRQTNLGKFNAPTDKTR